jgi:hypothetical protein
MRAHDFNQKTKRLLAQRAGNLCSNPECQAPTSGPCRQLDKSITTGDAAHITAASPNGPRFDPSLTSEERRTYDNGIWLCVTHARVVDHDEAGHSVELLRNWKTHAEAHARERLGKPQSLPPSSSRDILRFVKLAKSVLIGLRSYAQDFRLLGLHGPLTQMEALAPSLSIPIPIQIRTIPYPEGLVPDNPFLQDRFEGSLAIRFPDGSFESSKVAHTSGMELLMEARDSAIVALEQWVLLLEGGEQYITVKIEPDGAANESQAICPETSSTSSAAGFRR